MKNIAVTVLASIDDKGSPKRFAIRAIDEREQPLADEEVFLTWLLLAQQLGLPSGPFNLPPNMRIFAASVFTQYMKLTSATVENPCQLCGRTLKDHSPLLDHQHIPTPRPTP